MFCAYHYFYSICRLSRNYYKQFKGLEANTAKRHLISLYKKHSKSKDDYFIGITTALKWILNEEDGMYVINIISDPPSSSAELLTKKFFGVNAKTVQTRIKFFKKYIPNDLTKMAKDLEGTLGLYKNKSLPEFNMFNVFQVVEFEEQFLKDLSPNK